MDSLKEQYPLLTEKEIKEFTNMNLKIIHDERIKSKEEKDFSEESRKRCEDLQRKLDQALKELQLLRNKKENERPKITKQEYLD